MSSRTHRIKVRLNEQELARLGDDDDLARILEGRP
jgi:hypothetical protein